MTLIQADAFHLPYQSNYFHAIVTSPPYYALRKYQGDQGKEPLGLESTPERYIERMVEIFQEVRRVLRDDGVCWVNMGDCFATAPKGGPDKGTSTIGEKHDVRQPGMFGKKGFGIKQGNLMLMPHRLAIALQDDGWIVRNDLVWWKRNPMPESVAGWRWERSKIKTGSRGRERARIKGHFQNHSGNEIVSDAIWEYGDDYVLRKSSWRHTRAHEYVFQLVKKMGYFCNQEAVRERASESSIARINQENFDNQSGGEKDYRNTGINPNRSMRQTLENFAKNPGRNPRSVLDVPTQSYRGAHYATFPEKLIAPLIRASVPRRCCPECGMAWAPVVDKNFIPQMDVSLEKGIKGANDQKPAAPENRWDGTPRGSNQNTVTDYRATCECGHKDFEPGIVLDPFGGSGTTGMVAKQLLRRWGVMDISRPYLDEQAKVRTGSGTPSKALDGLPMFGELE